MRASATLLGALLVSVACSCAYAVHCTGPHCDTDIGRVTSDDEEATSTGTSLPTSRSTEMPQTTSHSTMIPFLPTIPTTVTPKTDTVQNVKQENITDSIKPKARLLNINVEDLHPVDPFLNQSESRMKHVDLSDVNLDEDDEPPHVINVDAAQSSHKQFPDKFLTKFEAPFHASARDPTDTGVCKENGTTYKIGDKIDRSCDETCECTASGSFECSVRCKHPYIRKGRKLSDPLCFESPVDDCCSIIACATDVKTATTTSPGQDICKFGNSTHVLGSKWEVGCEQICTCEKNSVVNCKTRCQKIPASDKCINVQDPNDSCCEVQVCDVSQDVHEEYIDNSTAATTTDRMDMEDPPEVKTTTRPLVLAEPITSVNVQNNTVKVDLMRPNPGGQPIHLLLSSDGNNFNEVKLNSDSMLVNLKAGNYVLMTKETGTKFNFTVTTKDTNNNANEVPIEDIEKNDSKIGCTQDGKFYAVGEEFHIGCTELCECTGHETRECAALQCPAHVGLELVSRGCVRWAPSPPPTPPNCCPRASRCLSDGTCHYKGHAIPNWSEVPISLTGCEQRCFCENGELDCQEVCSPLPPVPPQNHRCPPGHRPAAVNISDDDCCKLWGCVPTGPIPADLPYPGNRLPQSFLPTISPENQFPLIHQEEIPDYDLNNIHRPNSREPLPPVLAIPPHAGSDNKKLTVLSLQADSPTSVKMLFGLPPVLVGLRGSVDLRYTDKDETDISRWHSQVFAPADEILTTSRLEFRLAGLKPSTTYKIRGKLYLHNLPVEPESEVYSVKTLDAPMLEEKRRKINSGLAVADVNDTTAQVTWRYFTEDELRFIDGIQVRYRPVGNPIFSMTELLHHGRSNAELRELRPGSRYEASLVLVPPPKATVELYDPAKLEFNTLPLVDPYNWSVVVEARTVGSGAAEVRWRGVPAPAERWVRVYRAAHACGETTPGATSIALGGVNGGAVRTREHDAFRLAGRDTPQVITLTGLEPNSRCRIWLELFLTNGKVKTSNVLEINTKSIDEPEPIDNVIEASSISGGRGTARGDYYGALVVVGVVAALGALTSLLLLLVVVRRHRPHSVPITPVPNGPRESSLPPYDNPAYKLELQQETMDL